ncbi:MAG TPA: DUF4835 family protein [Cytophagaceae bacterium]
MAKNYFFLLVILIFPLLVKAQELNCNVTIDMSQMPAADKFIFDDLKEAITNFMNNRKWTNDAFNPEERIRCNIFLTMTGGGNGSYSATAQIQSSRPIYGTNYESTMLNFIDKEFTFEYGIGQPMDFNENSYLNNLTSMLGFYAYVILAMDYDSFSKLGGNPYIEKVRNIANAAQNAGGGWKVFGDPNNRASLSENLNSQQMTAFREGLYTYHRLAMDKFTTDPDGARKMILEVLTKIKSVNSLKPFTILVKSFFLAKSDELIKMFSQGDMQVRVQAVNIMKELDPLNSEKYNNALK